MHYSLARGRPIIVEWERRHSAASLVGRMFNLLEFSAASNKCPRTHDGKISDILRERHSARRRMGHSGGSADAGPIYPAV
ncbi:hypothetical protein EVAR_8715_1 [Eumeta japonica]|uniref:Uncharacterized protein n=1 Tax=Eumeta variegata TaxID=151549 RepID=A0A4C1XJX4_EUMVA|nr:hypothetical protein EVAR_8715_1 [Eumeta japonica]